MCRRSPGLFLYYIAMREDPACQVQSFLRALRGPRLSFPSSLRVIARRWRPGKFDDVVGQPHVVTTLRNSIRRGRIAHAYLFSGPRGVGKTSVSRILAKAVNCAEGMKEEPCNNSNRVQCHRLGRVRRRHRDRRGLQQGHRRDKGASGRRCGIFPWRGGTRSTSSTRRTCSRSRPSTRFSRRWRSPRDTTSSSSPRRSRRKSRTRSCPAASASISGG